MSAHQAVRRDRSLAIWLSVIALVIAIGSMFALWFVRERRYSEMQQAAMQGDVRKIALLVGQGADVNGGGRGTPPLILAATAYHVDAVEYLLRHGADPNVGNPGDNSTALYIIMGDSDQRPVAVEATARVLLKHGADVTRVPNVGTSAAYPGPGVNEIILPPGAFMGVPDSPVSRAKEMLKALKADPRFYQDYYTRIEPSPLPAGSEYGRIPEATMEASRRRLARMILQAGERKPGSGNPPGKRQPKGE